VGAGGLRSSAVRGCVGEHCGPESVRGALDTLGARRLAHGVRAIEDGALVARLAAERVCCDTCPTSNVMLRVVPSMASHPLPSLVAAGACLRLWHGKHSRVVRSG